MDGRLPTIDDVAKAAGVGKGTASRVINGSPKVSDSTRQRVLAAIEQLNFRPSATARRLSNNAAIRQIGVLESFITAPAFVDRLRGIQDVVESQPGFELLLFSCRSPERYEPALARIAAQRSVEALLVADLKISGGQASLLRDAHIAVVSLSGVRGCVPYVGADDVHGGYVATRHLIDLGHRKIGYVGDVFPDEFGFTTGRDRFEGYRMAMAEAGLPLNERWVGFGRHGSSEAVALGRQVLGQADRPTALFVMADLQAFGCIAAAQALGLRVPEDVSIIGFDDIEVSAHVGLTTVRQHLTESGRVAARYLLSLLRGDRAATLETLPPVEVVVRRTTKSLSARKETSPRPVKKNQRPKR
jgi:DNA-binding LacI/PurR family transcriptional regulator